MSAPWQYRIRVTGPDRDAWWERANAYRFGDALDLVSWTVMRAHLYAADGHAPTPWCGTWYNARTTNDGDFAEFFGNFSASPATFFNVETDSGPLCRVGPALFDGLNVTVEIVGHSWHADGPSGVYSYRDVYESGILSSAQCERASDASVAQKFAPELLTEFPDHLTAEQRAERDDPEDEPAPAPALSFPPATSTMTTCAHGVPFEDPTKDNGCKECAAEVRAYLSGLVNRTGL